jgi:hypothetical protein
LIIASFSRVGPAFSGEGVCLPHSQYRSDSSNYNSRKDTRDTIRYRKLGYIPRKRDWNCRPQSILHFNLDHCREDLRIPTDPSGICTHFKQPCDGREFGSLGRTHAPTRTRTKKKVQRLALGFFSILNITSFVVLFFFSSTFCLWGALPLIFFPIRTFVDRG